MLNICRTRPDGDRYHIATFNDIDHASMYVNAHMQAAKEVKQDEELIITYKYENKEEK